ncbi:MULTISPECIES: hypothetical protein [Bacillus]|uniref:Uncharacterized protein n=1 Tax=Bacillus glycinifermentans TaxID=1664069 RepID=A0AAJ4D1X5_9BACI|nr:MULTISPECIES: hypothetical protein [Bacillus]MDU0073313.1 hypothetical protein [Bacillus sp. IG6]MED8021113.1 hypothetical protein [Bacillus glycinifermentans]QAT64873.1 hypothetical protein EQZ20_08125 [Bacillus glycinifermentans]WKB78837.1 hypothetical protein QYM22_08375 [Bacillus glycinifermentans]
MNGVELDGHNQRLRRWITKQRVMGKEYPDVRHEQTYEGVNETDDGVISFLHTSINELNRASY